MAVNLTLRLFDAPNLSRANLSGKFKRAKELAWT